MKKLFSSFVFAALGTVLSSSAFAGLTTWTDTLVIDKYVGLLGNHSFTHDLTKAGQAPFPFIPGGMNAVKGSIAIEIYDDSCTSTRPFGCVAQAIQEGLSPEIVLFQIEEFDFDTGTLQFNLNPYAASLGLNALASINTDGMLDILIQSVGDDFIIGNSTLTIEGVPEPEMLGLMGAALVSLSLIRRRKAAC